MNRTYYKVRDSKTGLFRGGGYWARWDKRGKEWDTIAHIKQHFNCIPADKIDWENWEIVEYTYEPVETGSKSLKEFL
jgi:hypothetical protein